jgi:hypothetical protein
MKSQVPYATSDAAQSAARCLHQLTPGPLPCAPPYPLNPAHPGSPPASLLRRAVRASSILRDPTRTAPGCRVVQGTRSAGTGGNLAVRRRQTIILLCEFLVWLSSFNIRRVG